MPRTWVVLRSPLLVLGFACASPAHQRDPAAKAKRAVACDVALTPVLRLDDVSLLRFSSEEAESAVLSYSQHEGDFEELIESPEFRTRLALAKERHAWISPAEVLAGILYTKNAYRRLNRALRLGRMERVDEIFLTLVMRFLRGQSRHRGPTYRWMTMTPKLDELHGVGKTVRYRGLTSTSRNPNFDGAKLGGNMDTFVTIRSKNARNIDDFSGSPEEYEAIFAPNTEFRILKRSERNGIHYIEMEEIDPTEEVDGLANFPGGTRARTSALRSWKAPESTSSARAPASAMARS